MMSERRREPLMPDKKVGVLARKQDCCMMPADAGLLERLALEGSEKTLASIQYRRKTLDVASRSEQV